MMWGLVGRRRTLRGGERAHRRAEALEVGAKPLFGEPDHIFNLRRRGGRAAARLSVRTAWRAAVAAQARPRCDRDAAPPKAAARADGKVMSAFVFHGTSFRSSI